MALSDIRLAAANIEDGKVRDALNLIATHLEGYNSHTHVCAAEDAASSTPTSLSPTKAVPDGATNAFPI